MPRKQNGIFRLVENLKKLVPLSAQFASRVSGSLYKWEAGCGKHY